MRGAAKVLSFDLDERGRVPTLSHHVSFLQLFPPTHLQRTSGNTKILRFPQTNWLERGNIAIQAPWKSALSFPVTHPKTLETPLLLQIELAGATNILGSKWDDVLQSPTLEKLNVAGPFGSAETLASQGWCSRGPLAFLQLKCT